MIENIPAWTARTLPVRFAPRPHALPIGLVFGALLFLPGAIGYLVEDVSFSPGTVLVCFGVLALGALAVLPLTAQDLHWSAGRSVAAAIAILLHLFVADAIEIDPAFDLIRAGLSLLLIGAVLLAVPVLASALASGARLRTIVRVLCFVFFISAIFSLLKIQPPTQSLGEKPIFPYTEPSFLGFSMAGVLIFTVVRAPLLGRITVIAVFLGIGYALSNLTIIAACLLAAFVALPVSWLVAGVFAFVIGTSGIDLTYYTDRLNFDWANSYNISSLVYVQGWQMLHESLQRTHGWGVGFQQLGVVYTNVPASFRINALLGRDANLQDGGFILSKIGSEFGVIGLALVGVYLVAVVRSLARLRLMSRATQATISDGELFARACVIGYLIEVFVRGTNYFTGTLVLLLASLVYLQRLKPPRGFLGSSS